MSSESATAAFVSSLSATVHSQSMSLVFVNLHATESKSVPSEPAMYGQTWWNIWFAVGFLFGSVLMSTFSASCLMRPSSAIHHEKP